MGAGIFITFEGLDGAGKSTQLERLAKALKTQGKEVVVTREPGGTALGDKIRGVLLDSRTSGIDPLAELALMFAARAQHVRQVIAPALSAGKIVLSDRFTDSSEAYQGGGRELGSTIILELHRIFCGNLQPQLTILLDSDAAASVARARRRNHSRQNGSGKDEGRFERENRAFFERVREAYLGIARREPKRVLVINARRPIGTVHREILKLVAERLHIGAGELAATRDKRR